MELAIAKDLHIFKEAQLAIDILAAILESVSYAICFLLPKGVKHARSYRWVEKEQNQYDSGNNAASLEILSVLNARFY
jgi:hypothetical protein